VANEPKSVEAAFQVSLALPWLLKLPDAEYHAKRGRDEYVVRTKRHVLAVGSHDSPEPSVMFDQRTGELASATGAHVPGAMLRHTEVHIGFFTRVPSMDMDHQRRDRVIVLAYQALNHFLDVYRFAAGDTDIRPLSFREFHQVRAGQALFVQCHMREGEHGSLSRGVVFEDDDPMVLGKPATLAEAELTEFRERLRLGHRPVLGRLLLLNAQMYCSSGQTRFGVIDMNAALDIVAEQKAGKCAEPAVPVERLERMTTVAIMQEVLLPRVDRNHQIHTVWADWFGTFRQLRNRVIHDAYEPTLDEAERSLDNISHLYELVDSLKVPIEQRKPV
jgi:hypothetical protein